MLADVKNIKVMFRGVATVAQATVYTVPASAKNAVIKELFVHNSSASDTVNIIVKIGAVTLVNTTIAPLDTIFPDKEWFTSLNTGDTVTVSASANNIAEMQISGVEISSVAVE